MAETVELVVWPHRNAKPKAYAGGRVPEAEVRVARKIQDNVLQGQTDDDGDLQALEKRKLGSDESELLKDVSTQPSKGLRIFEGRQQSYVPWSSSRVELGGAGLRAFHTGPTAVGCREREWLNKYNQLNASNHSSTAPRIDLKYLFDPQKYTRRLGPLATACNSDQTFERRQTGSKPL
ncbi:hypothetical protein DFH09DRAFT_1084650 [Mycena vulgaris]|nr:hypothetical protein DFH09DRAFT_1084650 [Mycena vulgaris]